MTCFLFTEIESNNLKFTHFSRNVFTFLAVKRETLQNTLKFIEFIESFIYPTDAQLDFLKMLNLH